MKAPRLTICFDNVPGPSVVQGSDLAGLTTLWGFSAVIELAGEVLLFDTGSNGRVLLRNLKALGWHPGRLDRVFLSHPHWDHIGGLDSILELNPRLEVVLHAGFSKHLIADLERLCAKVTIVESAPTAIGQGLWSTGQLDSEPPEHALLIDQGAVTAAVSGCDHPGMEQIVARGTEILGKRIDWAVGGFHLMYADQPAIERAIVALHALEVRKVVPTHCTGEQARTAFAKAWGEHCVDGGVGRVIELV
ncbi:MBL fold metallo-hydrolase [Halochromatium glycolicum]|uniref:Metal-dependent hydrolase n=1 Tax=Halochromatium glycolicum TaxID=85075 RepID=A0AAJ0XBP2_9GAMM|nr:MBL fold metallo-hydrolase [Halochromatium glycolicum]MBK1706593.1 metal-dependent hydrolase [Halochromatium glycolicum]